MNAPSGPWPLSWVARFHRALVFGRRVRVLAELLELQILASARVLDVGCGDGSLGKQIADHRPDISVEGVELAVRPDCQIPCRAFNGIVLPFPDASYDLSLLVDVLHHTDDATVLLREAVRVSRTFVLIKDHFCESALDEATLRGMDWVGNRPHGVRLPYNYQSRAEWDRTFAECGLKEDFRTTRLPLYPFPFSLALGRGLHFISRLRKA